MRYLAKIRLVQRFYANSWFFSSGVNSSSVNFEYYPWQWFHMLYWQAFNIGPDGGSQNLSISSSCNFLWKQGIAALAVKAHRYQVCRGNAICRLGAYYFHKISSTKRVVRNVSFVTMLLGMFASPPSKNMTLMAKLWKEYIWKKIVCQRI